MKLFSNQSAFIEEDEILVEAPQPSGDIKDARQNMREKAELFLAVVERVSDPGTSYINEYSWLFGKG